ncbi:MAG: type II toxin-antitoxin system RelE/ParE family toxin [Proteobacteria bacterium]|nr:type II toxin-antitoxin system RelE/ParE family toxin [Pseudomonadota bacterium]
MKRLRIDAAARAELLHETHYYESTRRGTGRRFREAVTEVFERIKRAPLIGKPDEEGCRRLRVAGFPFSVVYRDEASELVVYAIRPDARQPGYWLARTR